MSMQQERRINKLEALTKKQEETIEALTVLYEALIGSVGELEKTVKDLEKRTKPLFGRPKSVNTD